MCITSTLCFGSTQYGQANFHFFSSIKKKKDVSRCLGRTVSGCSAHIIDICYFPFYVRRQYQRKLNDKSWVMKVCDQKEVVIIASLNILLKLPTNSICFASKISLPKRHAKTTLAWHMEPGGFYSRRYNRSCVGIATS